ncbi:MAG: 3-dehydroquinate synthase [Gemmatimonadaceae bacterium]
MFEPARANPGETVSGDVSYPVYVNRGLLGQLALILREHTQAHRYAIIADATVATHHAIRVRSEPNDSLDMVVTVPPGEVEKTRARWSSITDELLARGFGRDTVIIALGGGVVCDLAGFVAATYMRGIPIVQVPTTLLAMVDASIGGKTGVDTTQGKNLVGAFHNPTIVVVDPDLLKTLPLPVFRSGLAEMIKHGAIRSAKYFDDMVNALPELAGDNPISCAALPALIAESIRIKASVVATDERESGLRQVLNFGHTIAHAIEQNAGYEMLHGDAVAIGMVVESEIAERINLCEQGTSARIIDAVTRAGLPSTVPANQSIEAIIASTYGDKKARAGSARYALPSRIGAMAAADTGWSVAVPDDITTAALSARRV